MFFSSTAADRSWRGISQGWVERTEAGAGASLGEVVARYENGWIKVHRRAVIEDIGDNVICLGLWVTFLALATWKESKVMWNGQQRVLPPGSVVYGITEFAERWGVSKSTVKRWVEYLVSTERIRNESGTRGSIATICNWEKYQAQDDDAERERNESGTPTEHGPNTGRTPAEPYEEGKKVRREEGKEKDSKFHLSEENLNRGFTAWETTLIHFKAARECREGEKEQIARWIQREGINAVEMAFLGARHEKAGEGFNPADFLRLDRYLKSGSFERFLNLGVQAWHKQKETP